MNSPSEKSAQKEVNCWNCCFFSISWDPNHRYRCQRLGFKSRQLPSIDIRQIDGRDCLYFKTKPGT
ncbi:MAG: uracil-DNA glycosylase [Gammaproteobacteria bacterium]|nr:uracil-DNA glycosylase [Gammaproteobacteria bacterium]